MGDKRHDRSNYCCLLFKLGVGGNSIQCTVCKGWVHKRCSGIKGKLPANRKDFECRKCQDRNQGGMYEGGREVVEGQIERVEIEVGEELEVVKSFCYLGDVIEAGGGVEAAITVRMRCAWKKFWELEHILMMKGLSLRFKGKVYSACVRSVMMYGSETWAVKVENVQRMERTEMQMVRLMCGVKLRERFRNEELRGWMGIEQLGSVIRRGRSEPQQHTFSGIGLHTAALIVAPFFNRLRLICVTSRETYWRSDHVRVALRRYIPARNQIQ